ncbi:MAG: hypothetical protein EHM13_02270, partial [Acidobacteria bacterium]
MIDQTSDEAEPATTRQGVILLAAGTAVILAWAAIWWRFTLDDTYISLRYADNLARGHGAVFNLGERVEGYSSPLWVLLLAIPQAAGWNALPVAKAVGVLCAVGLPVLLFSTLRRLQCRSLIAGAAALWLASVPGIHAYASSGMETLAFALAVALAVALPAFWPRPPVPPGGVLVLLVVVAVLRPEGLFLAVALGVFWYGVGGRARLGVLAALVVLSALVLARYHYYGTWLPNTYLAKTSPLVHAVIGQDGPTSLKTLYLSLYVRPLETLDGIGGTALALCALLALVVGPRTTGMITAALSAAVGAVFVGYAPMDWMPAGRFALPFVFPLLVLAAVGLDTVTQRMGTADSRLRLAFGGVLAGWVALNAALTGNLWLRYERGDLNTALDARPYETIGRWLAENTAETDAVLANEIGAIGFFSKRRIIDHEGLVTPDVARVIHRSGGFPRVSAGENRRAVEEIVAYCVAERPDWFLVRSKGH